MKSIFQRYYRKYDAWYDQNRFAFLSELAAIKKALPKNGKGLEIGVGTGRFAAALGITTGIDPSKNMVMIARKRGVDARVGYGEHLPFENSSFDYAAIIVTICFVCDPQRVLREAGRVLKKNGKVIIGIVDKQSFLGKFYQKRAGIFYKQANFFSVSDIRGLLKAAGFNRFSYKQTIFQMPGEIHSVQKPANGFGRGGFVVISATPSREQRT
ncbi:class I SAM-dependent methyltransferase [Candidatus Omnitrophota bacterium]